MAEILAFQTESEDAPTNKMWKVSPGRPKNADVRDREHLTPDEVASLIEAAGKVGRHRHRDKTLILTMYRHGLRVSELVDLKWESIDFKQATIHVTRKKNGTPATHPIEGDELRALRKLKRDYPQSRFVFQTERGGPLTRFTVNKLIARAGQKAEIPFPVHPHQLRHACGFYLANRGIDTRTIQAYLGHKSITHTCMVHDSMQERGFTIAASSRQAYAEQLQSEITATQRSLWGANLSPLFWANESYAFAQGGLVKYCVNKDGECHYSEASETFAGTFRVIDTSEEYEDVHREVIEMRIKQAGVRLGALLNGVFTN